MRLTAQYFASCGRIVSQIRALINASRRRAAPTQVQEFFNYSERLPRRATKWSGGPFRATNALSSSEGRTRRAFHKGRHALIAFSGLLVAVVIRLVGTGLRHGDVVRLLGREFGQFHPDLGQMQARDLLVQMLGQGIDLLLILARI